MARIGYTGCASTPNMMDKHNPFTCQRNTNDGVLAS
jgi:hypothetical protein